MSLEKDVEECKNCRFVYQRQEPLEGVGVTVYTTVAAYFCVRYPPSIKGIIRVAEDGWCGEYKKKKPSC